MINKKVLRNVSAPLMSRWIMMDIAVLHLLVGETKPLLCEFAIVFSLPREHDAYFFFHNNLPVMGDKETGRKPYLRRVILPSICKGKAFCLVVASQHFTLVGASHLPPTFCENISNISRIKNPEAERSDAQ